MEGQSSSATNQFFHRTRSLARKLALNPSLLIKYNDILADQEHRGFIERVEDPANTTKYHYIPHHAICKDLPTTPVRIVYDCSCHQARNQPSLNDCLLSSQPQLDNLTSRRPSCTYSSMQMIETTPDFSGYVTHIIQTVSLSLTDLEWSCLVLFVPPSC